MSHFGLEKQSTKVGGGWGGALWWRCGLSGLISRETGRIRGREHQETPAMMDEL